MSADKKDDVALEVSNTNSEVVNSSTNKNTTDTEVIDSTVIKKSLLKNNKYFAYLCSTEFLIILLIGQFLSFCITATIVTSEQLAIYNVNFPTTQTFLTYIVLLIVYTPIDIYKKGFMGWLKMLKTRWWQYFLLSLFDVEGNYFVVKSYQYTSVLSIMLLDTWTTPCVVLLSIIFLKFKYHWSQYLAVIICLGGVGVLIGGDFINKNDMHSASNLVLGDIFCILGATFYAFSNVGEEYLVRKRPIYEVVGQLGFFGAIISAIQLAALERKELADVVWTGPVIGLVIAYTIAMFCLYSVVPILFRLSNSAFFNLSLLTSDFYSLIFAINLFHEPMNNHLYIVAYVGTLLGLTIYNIYPAMRPEKDKKDDNETEEKDIEATEEN